MVYIFPEFLILIFVQIQIFNEIILGLHEIKEVKVESI